MRWEDFAMKMDQKPGIFVPFFERKLATLGVRTRRDRVVRAVAQEDGE